MPAYYACILCPPIMPACYAYILYLHVMPTYYALLSCLHVMPTYYAYIICLHIMPTYYAYILCLHIMPTYVLNMNIKSFNFRTEQNTFSARNLEDKIPMGRGSTVFWPTMVLYFCLTGQASQPRNYPTSTIASLLFYIQPLY